MSVTVAYLGPEGTFTEAAVRECAARGYFGTESIAPLACSSPREAIDAVRDGHAEFACIAIENSVDGPVTPAFDALAAGDGVQIYHELDLAISFAVMVRRGFSLDDGLTVATHPVGYQQVKGWLGAHLPNHEFIAASSNAAAAQMVAEGKVDVAVAPKRAAELFDLAVVAENVADVAGARTRFVVVGAPGKPTARSGSDRTAVMFTVRNSPGSLVAALTEFALRGVDLSRIESRPIEGGLGTYRFHVDLNGHIDEAPVAEALRALYLRCEQIIYLGSWPAGVGEDEERLARDTARIEEATAWVAAMRGGTR